MFGKDGRKVFEHRGRNRIILVRHIRGREHPALQTGEVEDLHIRKDRPLEGNPKEFVEPQRIDVLMPHLRVVGRVFEKELFVFDQEGCRVELSLIPDQDRVAARF